MSDTMQTTSAESQTSAMYDDALEMFNAVNDNDQILFNDRVQPLVVESADNVNYSNDKRLKLKGQQGGRYRIRINTNRESVSLRRKTGQATNEELGVTLPTFDSMTLYNLEIANQHEIKAGQIFERTNFDGKSRFFTVIADLNRNSYGLDSIRVRVRDGEVKSVNKGTAYRSTLKEKLFGEGLELVGEIGDTTYTDTEREEEMRISSYGDRGVYVIYDISDGTKRLNWELFLPELSNRFEPVEN